MRHGVRGWGVVGLSAVLGIATGAGADPFDFQLILNDASSGLGSFGAVSTYVSGGGGGGAVHVFSATDAIGTGLYSTTAGGPRLTIMGGDFGVSISGTPSVAPNGDVMFTGTDATGDGLFLARSSGGPLLTIRGADFGVASIADPSVNSSGEFIFTGTDAVGATGLYGVRQGAIITLHGSNFGNGQARITEGGVAIFSPAEAGELEGIYAQPLGGGTRLTIVGTGFGSVRALDSDDDGDVVYSALDINGVGGLYRASLGGGLHGTIPWINEFGALSDNVALNNLGTVVFGTDDAPGQLETIHVIDLDGTFLRTIISVGDELDGSVVTELRFHSGGLGDDNTFSFFASLSDGTSGLYAVHVPAPGVGAVALAGAGIALRRRRR